MEEISEQFLIVEPDAFIRAKLEPFLKKAGYGQVCAIVEEAKGVSAEGFIELDVLSEGSGRFRLGLLLDVLKARTNAASPLKIGTYMLDIAQNTLKSAADERTIRLTEKEAGLLKILHDKGGKSIAREALLEQVWDYADGVETHTLETHIYRLRQKIEDDPSEPKILMTDEQGGYFLNLE